MLHINASLFSSGRAPYCDGTHYAAWKHKMKMYLTAIHPSIWWIVETGYTAKDIGNPAYKEEQNEHKNAVAANAILSALSPEEYNKVYACMGLKVPRRYGIHSNWLMKAPQGIER